jgi:hypothetical protein
MALPPQFQKKGAPGAGGESAGPPARFAKKKAFGRKRKGGKSAPAQKALRMGGSMRGGAR